MAWLVQIRCNACSFPAREIVLDVTHQYCVCEKCSDIVKYTPTPLYVTPLRCPLCNGSLIGAACVGTKEPIACPSCKTGPLVIQEKMHLLARHEHPQVHVGDIIHGRVVKRGRFFQMDFHEETYWRGRFISPPGEEMVDSYIEATVVEVGRKTLVLDNVNSLSPELLASAGL